MKQINIFKKAIHATSILLLSLTLFSCNNGTSDTNNVLSVKGNNGITVNGTISINGAGPNFSRSATSTIPSAITWVITAETDDYEEGVSGATAYAASTTQSFNISFSKSGTWIITVKGYKGTYTDKDDNNHYIIPETADCPFTGMREVDIPETGLSSSIRLSVSANNTTGTGYIALEISDTSGKIKNGTATFLSTQIDSTPITKKFTFTNGTTSVEAQNIPAGSYTAKFTFEDAEDGNILYSCKEAINVYDGLTTNTWYGKTPYLQTIEEKVCFIITQNLLDSYPSEQVSETNYFLYSDNNIYLTSSLTDIGTEPYLTQEDGYNRVKSCFDSEGNLYTLSNAEGEYDVSVSGYPYTVRLYKNTDLICEIPGSSNTTQFIWFCIDPKTDTFYFIGEDKEYDKHFYKCVKDNLTNLNDSKIEFTIDSMTTGKCIVNNNIIYFVYGNELIIADISGVAINSPSVASSKIETYYYTGGTFSKVTDILYQDNAIYILNQNSKGNDNMNTDGKGLTFKSQCSLVKFNTCLKSFDTLGGNNQPLETTGKWLYTGGMNGYNLFDYQYFTDETCTSHALIKADDITTAPLNLYYPITENNQLSSTEFYGPQAFVAIKPKKLVIADNGLAVYTDAYGLFRAKNVNRIVIVDLESFSISDTKEFSDTIYFTEDVTKFSISLCGFNWGPENLYDENHELIYDKTVEYDPNAEEGNPLKAPTVYYKQENSTTHEIEDKSMTLSNGSFDALIVNIPVDTNE